jgi:16S rRNA (uracil1498-N3)-methyltransferase
MRLHRFFITTPLPHEGEFSIADENLLNQWRNVLRMSVGDHVILFDGSDGEILCEFRALEKKSATFFVVEQRAGLKLKREVTLFMSLIKRDHFELVLEKATELGVTRIVPVEAARSEKKGINRERSEKIIREAAEQSGRTSIPVLDDPVSIQKIPDMYKISFILFDPRSEFSARAYSTPTVDARLGILIGPEGGFTDEELEFFKTNKTPILSTGPTILRAETAAIVALTLALV